MATTRKSAKVAKSGAKKQRAKKQRAKKAKGKKVKAPPQYMALLLDFTKVKNKVVIEGQVKSFVDVLASQGVVIAKARTP